MNAKKRTEWLEALRVQRSAFLSRWSKQVGKALGRPAKRIELEGLTAGDFHGNVVQIKFEEGSHVCFRNAFHVRKPGPNKTFQVAVLTEHCGYHEFLLGSDDTVTENAFGAENA